MTSGVRDAGLLAAIVMGLAVANMRGFDVALTRPDAGHRYAGRAPIFTQPTDGAIPVGSDLLFLVRASGALAPVTHQHPGTQGGGHHDPARPRARGFVMLPARARAVPGWPGGGAGMRRQCPELAAGQCQGHLTMMAEPPQSPVTEAVRSLEVRWIFPGQLEAAVAGWFGRFPARTESREDTYLLDPQLRGLSVKLRGGGALEVKSYRGSPGILEVAGRARGRLQSWQKWSFPFSPLPQDSGDPAGWSPVRKRRRISRFSGASGLIVAPAPRLGGEPRCEVELTEIHTSGQDWWTLGFEATGPADLLRSELQATAALVFAQALPGAVEPGPDESRSYAEWLCQRLGGKNDA